QVPLGALTKAKATTSASFQGNLDANGPLATGASNLLSNDSLTDVSGGAPAPPSSATLLTDLQDTTTGQSPFVAGDTLTLKGSKGGRDLAPLTYTIDATSTVQNLQDFFNQGLGIDTTLAGPPAPGATLSADPADPNAAQLNIIGNTGTDNL